MPPLTMQEEGLTKGTSCHPTALCQVPLNPLPQVLAKVVSQQPGPGVFQVGGSPHMCPWVGPHVPPLGRQLWGLPSHVDYLSPQGVLLPLVYGRKKLGRGVPSQ